MKAELCNLIFISVIDQYHINNDVDSSYVNPYNLDTLEYLLFEKCWIDTVQWHLENLIRNPNIDSNKGLELKHRIDKSNQTKTELILLRKLMTTIFPFSRTLVKKIVS